MVKLKDEHTSLSALFTLLEIDSNNRQVFETLIQLFNTTKDESIFTSAARILQQFNLNRKLETEKLNKLIAVFIRFIQTSQDVDLLDIADSLTTILQKEHLSQVVIILKDYLSEQFYKNSSYRYEAVFNIIWHCAENLTYPDFHKAIN